MPGTYKPWHKEFLTDPGIDGGGIRRDITRDTQVAKRLLVEASPCDWSWILRNIWAKKAAECARVDLLDTVVCEGGAVQYYMFTSQSGQVMRKNRRFASLARVREEFLRIAVSAYEPDLFSGGGAGSEAAAAAAADAIPTDAPVCLVHKQDGSLEPLNFAKFDSLCKAGAPPPDAVAMQAFVAHKDIVAEAHHARPPRENSNNRNEQKQEQKPQGGDVHNRLLANFCHEYKLNAVGVPTNAYIRLGVSPGVTGSNDATGAERPGSREGGRMGATSLANLNKPINDRMDAMALALVRQVERKKKARVVHMVTEFLVDAESRVWLLRTSECLLAADGPSVRTRPEAERQQGRKGAAVAVGDALTQAGGAPQKDEANDYGVPIAGKRGLGANSEVRLARRRAREAVPDEEAVQRVLAEVSQSVSESVSQSVGQSVSQSVGQSVSQSVGRS